MVRAKATDTAAVVAAAASVFRTKGYRNTTIDDIAKAAGIAKPTVYQYAKSKQWLLSQVVDGVIKDLDRRVQVQRDLTLEPIERLHSTLRAHVAAAVELRTFYGIVLNEEAELPPATRKRFRVWAHRITEEFRCLLAECAPTAALDHGVAANLIITMITSLHRWYDPKGPLSPDALAEQVLLAVDGLLAPGVRFSPPRPRARTGRRMSAAESP
jgi:TetR/AcrR family transcriptional regulator, cholesterol catabolism regulator